MTFSEKLLRLRKREGLSQEELALYLNVSRQAVSRWEQGTAMPDAGNLLKLKQRFGVSVDWLLENAQGWESCSGIEAGASTEVPGPERTAPAQSGLWLIWAIPLVLSFLGLLVLGIFSSLHPGQYETAVAAPFGIGGYRNKVYTGLMGSLKCHDLEWLFWLCVVIAAGSLAVCVWQRYLRLKAEERRGGPAEAEK